LGFYTTSRNNFSQLDQNVFLVRHNCAQQLIISG